MIMGWWRVYVIAMAHPDWGLFACPEPLKEAPPIFNPKVGPAVLAPVCAGHFAASQVGQQLHAVAEAQHRCAELE